MSLRWSGFAVREVPRLFKVWCMDLVLQPGLRSELCSIRR